MSRPAFPLQLEMWMKDIMVEVRNKDDFGQNFQGLQGCFAGLNLCLVKILSRKKSWMTSS